MAQIKFTAGLTYIIPSGQTYNLSANSALVSWLELR